MLRPIEKPVTAVFEPQIQDSTPTSAAAAGLSPQLATILVVLPQTQHFAALQAADGAPTTRRGGMPGHDRDRSESPRRAPTRTKVAVADFAAPNHSSSQLPDSSLGPRQLRRGLHWCLPR